MAFDAKGNLLVGTEPSGRVLRITKKANASARKDKDKEPAAEGFVLYETAKREITALAVAPDGNVYAAAIGEKQHAGRGKRPRSSRHPAARQRSPAAE